MTRVRFALTRTVCTQKTTVQDKIKTYDTVHEKGTRQDEEERQQQRRQRQR